MTKIDAKGLHYQTLNKQIRTLVNEGETQFELINVNGQRFIGDGIRKNITIDVKGIPGNDLGAFMNGPIITIHNNAQDTLGNTMNAGKIIVHGHAGDVLGYGMRGGKIFIKDDVGYRVGIHMKSYKEQIPILVAGGIGGDFFGEYMAGGILVLLNLQDKKEIVGNYLGTGMHGGAIYLRGEVEPHKLGAEVGIKELTEDDKTILNNLIKEYSQDFGFDPKKIMKNKFIKLIPVSLRPYGRMYAY